LYLFVLAREDKDYFSRFQIKFQDETFAIESNKGLVGKAFLSKKHVTLEEIGDDIVHGINFVLKCLRFLNFYIFSLFTCVSFLLFLLIHFSSTSS
jgi:hypothetical protein